MITLIKVSHEARIIRDFVTTRIDKMSKRILLVEDEAPIRDLAQFSLLED